SGEVALTGAIRKATIDTVSGSTMVDASGEVNSIALNTVAGSSTVRLDEGVPANYVVRTMGGRILVDGVERGSSGPSSYSGRSGELAGSFVDVRGNSVSGNVTVLRRAKADETPVDDGEGFGEDWS